ncbi:Hsp20/alpha crystallin family protein [Aphelenchoides avenae]|nr:Hsp20/alpha crystallin family protein [Aphelenchus avenae]
MRFIVFAGLLCGAAGGSRTDEEDIPSVRIQPKSLQFAEGKTFSLTCNVDAKPTPELIWFFEGKRLYPDLKYNITKNELSVRGTTKQDAGLYECRAVNPAGTKTNYATVQLAGTLDTALLGYAAVAVCTVVSIAVVCRCVLVCRFKGFTDTRDVEATGKDRKAEQKINDRTRHSEYDIGLKGKAAANASVVKSKNIGGSPQSVAGAGDTVITENGFTIPLDVKHFEPKDIKLSLSGSTLTVTGERTEKNPSSEQTLKETGFCRRFVVPAQMKLDRVECHKSDNGQLVIKGIRKQPNVAVLVVQVDTEASKPETPKKIAKQGESALLPGDNASEEVGEQHAPVLDAITGLKRAAR